MRNVAHIKKFVEPATIEIEASKGPEKPELPKQVVEPVQCDPPAVGTATGSPPEQPPKQFRYISTCAHRA